jgi:hypothetical protein
MRWRPPSFRASPNSAKWNINSFFWWSIITFSIIMLTPVFILGLVFGLILESQAQHNLLVDLDYAKYNGVSGANGINQWLGVRYAAPPTGNNRFRAPQDPAVNTNVQQANKVSLADLIKLIWR